MRPLHEQLAESSHVTGERLRTIVVQWVCMVILGGVCWDLARRPMAQLDIRDAFTLKEVGTGEVPPSEEGFQEVGVLGGPDATKYVVLQAAAPVEPMDAPAPDLLNAMGLAAEVVERMTRLNGASIAENQAWVMNRMVDELAARYKKDALDIVRETRKKKGDVSSEVMSVTPLRDELPFRVEVVTMLEFSGEYEAPRQGKEDPFNARKREFRFVVELVRTERTVWNRDGLLIRDVSMANTR